MLYICRRKINMVGINCKVGCIYVLYYNNKPFYIGQTKDRLRTRIRKHFNSCFSSSSRYYYVYDFIKSKTTKDNFYNDITYKCLKICNVNDLDFEEVKYIKHCIDKDVKLFNSCVKTISYISKKHGMTIQEYNYTRKA